MYVLVMLEPIGLVEIKSRCDDKHDNLKPRIPTLAQRRGAHYLRQERVGIAFI